MSTNGQQRPRVVLVNRCFVINNRGEILIIRRREADIINPGLWEVPGGKLDEGQDLTRALEREVMEETGLLIEPTHRLVYADSQVLGPGKYSGMPYMALFSVGRVVGGELKLSEEHTEVRWARPHESLGLDLTPETRKALIVLAEHLE